MTATTNGEKIPHTYYLLVICINDDFSNEIKLNFFVMIRLKLSAIYLQTEYAIFQKRFK